MNAAKRRRAALARLESKITRTSDGHWLWHKPVTEHSQLRVTLATAQRITLQLRHGIFYHYRRRLLPRGTVFVPACKHPRCVRPEHARILSLREFNDEIRPLVKGEGHPSTKLSDNSVRAIRAMVAGGVTQAQAARWFDVSQPCVCNIVNRKTRTDVMGEKQ